MYFCLFIQMLGLENWYLDELGTVWSLEFSFPQNRHIYLGYMCKSGPRHGQIPLRAVQTTSSSLPAYKCWMPWFSLLYCRICTGIAQGRIHLVTLQSHMDSYIFFSGKIERTCAFCNLKAGCWRRMDDSKIWAAAGSLPALLIQKDRKH